LWGLASLSALWAAHRHDGDLWVGDEGLRWALGLGLAHLLGLFLVERLGALGPLLWPAGWPLPRWAQGGWRAAPPLLALGIWIGAGMEATPPPARSASPRPISNCNTNHSASTQTARNQPIVMKMNGGGSASRTRAEGNKSR
jgi:hypothetical protein